MSCCHFFEGLLAIGDALPGVSLAADLIAMRLGVVRPPNAPTNSATRTQPEQRHGRRIP